MLAYPCYVDPLTSIYDTEKMGVTWALKNIYFFALKHSLFVLVRTASMRKYKKCHINKNFAAVKNCSLMLKHICVINIDLKLLTVVLDKHIPFISEHQLLVGRRFFNAYGL